MPKNKFEVWLALGIYIAFGAAVGALLGLAIWVRLPFWLWNSGIAGALCIGGGALIGGLFIMFGRDRLWR